MPSTKASSSLNKGRAPSVDESPTSSSLLRISEMAMTSRSRPWKASTMPTPSKRCCSSPPSCAWACAQEFQTPPQDPTTGPRIQAQVRQDLRDHRPLEDGRGDLQLPVAAVRAVLLVGVENPLEQPRPADAVRPRLKALDLPLGSRCGFAGRLLHLRHLRRLKPGGPWQTLQPARPGLQRARSRKRLNPSHRPASAPSTGRRCRPWHRVNAPPAWRRSSSGRSAQ